MADCSDCRWDTEHIGAALTDTDDDDDGRGKQDVDHKSY